jgi:hypothetical protein
MILARANLEAFWILIEVVVDELGALLDRVY